MKKIILSLSIMICTILSFFEFSFSASRDLKEANVNVRTVELSNTKIDDDSYFDAFDSYELEIDDNKSCFDGYYSIDLSDVKKIDNVSLNDYVEKTSIKFSSTFDFDTGYQTLDVYIIDDNQDISLIDTVYGVALMTNSGEVDFLFDFDGELIFQSELRNLNLIDEVGWFKSLVKSATTKVANVAKNVANTVSNTTDAAIKVLSTDSGKIGTLCTLASCAVIGAACAFIPGGQIVTCLCAGIAGSIVGGVGFELTAKAAQKEDSTITSQDVSYYEGLGKVIGSTVSICSCKAMTSYRTAKAAEKAAKVADAENAISNSKITGQWQKVNETMSDASRKYQEYIVGGHNGEAFVQNGVKFDGVIDGNLIDAKGHYSQFVDSSSGTFQEWFTGSESLIDEASRQIVASNGAHIQWYFAEEESMNAFYKLFITEFPEALEFIEFILKIME